MFLEMVTIGAFILMFLPVFVLGFLERQRHIVLLRLVAGVGLASAAYCVAAGIALLSESEPLFVAGNVAQFWKIVTLGHYDGAFVERTTWYWPYGLILAGGFWTVVYGVTQWRAKPA